VCRVQDGAYRVNAPTVAAETVDGEVLMIHLDSGNYYSLRAVGASIWEALELGVPLAEIASTLRDSYGGDATGELLDEFVDQLVREDLLAAVAEPTPRGPTPWKPPTLDGEFVGPRLEKFTDMQHLILLDPVHEVDAGQGWPMRRSDP
jgi:hypothetical protein